PTDPKTPEGETPTDPKTPEGETPTDSKTPAEETAKNPITTKEMSTHLKNSVNMTKVKSNHSKSGLPHTGDQSSSLLIIYGILLSGLGIFLIKK
ncbi:LPXTG cell wall anchor domain-containing protein, partial [Listeria booriae]